MLILGDFRLSGLTKINNKHGWAKTANGPLLLIPFIYGLSPFDPLKYWASSAPPYVQNQVFKAPHLLNPCDFPPSAVLLAWDPLVILFVSLFFLPPSVLPLSPHSPPSLPPRHLVPAAGRRALQQGPHGVAAMEW
jgi:hypothetical protein